MANYRGIASAAVSIERLLNACFTAQQPISADSAATAAIVTTEDFKKETDTRIPKVGVSIFPFRIDVNKPQRGPLAAVGHRDGRGHLPLDLHILITAWATNPEYELRILGRAMQCLESTPILTGPLLDSAANWQTTEGVQVVIGEMTTEEIMRTFDSLPHEYKLSVPYVARAIRIDTVAIPQLEVTTSVLGIVPSSAT